MNRCRQRRDLRPCLAFKRCDQLADEIWLDQGFIALKVDDQFLVRPTLSFCHFTDSFGPTLMVLAGHQRGHSKVRYGSNDPVIVCRNKDLPSGF
jgi:hypothetical protein